MRNLLLLSALLWANMASADEAALKATLIDMLARFTTYVKADFQPCQAPNSVGEACGCFKGEHTMASDERGVRPNADLSMICAFLVKYGPKEGVTLPKGISWQDLETMARKSLIFAYSTHKANRLKPCSDGRYWGSISEKDHSWESSLWAMSVAYSAFFQWEKLTEDQRRYIRQLLVAECDYELERTIPTGYQGDTKAEENGWEACVLAATLGLFPNDERAPQWFQRLRAFAINSYSHPSDAMCTTVIDPDRDTITVADLYQGPNLFADYTLQNHNLFHTSYQNVVQQELGEAALALHLFQKELYGRNIWHTNALMHHVGDVQREVLNHLALSDGELAMPNGNDWSLFLYDQITSYSTLACFLRDPDALMLESLAAHNIATRQRTTEDGSFLLRPDVGARRNGVQAHRVMMSWLMHHEISTQTLTPTAWETFRAQHSAARTLPCQRIVRAFTKDRFTCFSWSEGLKSYTGYFTPNDAPHSNLIVPYRAHNTGNLIGWSLTEGHATNACPATEPKIAFHGDSYTLAASLYTNDSTLLHHFAIFSTAGNALLYIDQANALAPLTITAQQGGLLAISTDPFTTTTRNLYFQGGQTTSDGSQTTHFSTPWLNIDHQIGIVTPCAKHMIFGEKEATNSILTAKLYALADTTTLHLTKGQTAFRRSAAYYSRVSAQTTAQLSTTAQSLTTQLPDGWNAIYAHDPDGTAYLLIANFCGKQSQTTLTTQATSLGAPVFSQKTSINYPQSQTTLHLKEGETQGLTTTTFVEGTHLEAQQQGEKLWLKNTHHKKTKAIVTRLKGGEKVTKSIKLRPQEEITL